jgi:hypothetical protein
MRRIACVARQNRLGTLDHDLARGSLHPHPVIRGKLTDQQVMDVLAYVRMMAPFDPLS